MPFQNDLPPVAPPAPPKTRRTTFPDIIDPPKTEAASTLLWRAPSALLYRLKASWTAQGRVLNEAPKIDRSLLWIFVGILGAAVLVKFGLI